MEKDSLSSFDAAPTRKRFYASNISNRRALDEAGKILKNASP